MIRSQTARKIANNTIYQLVGKLISMSITVLATVIVARTYGREGYGEFSLMQNIPALFFIIVDFGLNAISTRELSKNYDKAERYFGNILIMRVVSSLFLMLLVGISINFFPYNENLKLGIYLSLLLILTQALYATTNVIFQVKLRYDLSAIGYITGSIVVLALVLITTNMRMNIVWVNFSYVVGGLVTFLVNISLLSRFIDLKQCLTIDKSIIKYLTIQSLPLGLMFIFSQINFKADAILLSVLPLPDKYSLNNTESVAVYSLPYKIFEVALVVPTFLMNAVYPVFVRHLEENNQRFLDTFYKTTLTLFGVGLLGAIMGIIFAPLAINLLGGSEFSQSVDVLRLLVVGLPIFYVTQPISWLIVTLENQRVLPFIYFVSALFNFISNIVFIPKYSFFASSALTWLSEIIILLLLVYFGVKTWKRKYA